MQPRFANCCYKEYFTDHCVLLLSFKNKPNHPCVLCNLLPMQGVIFLWYSKPTNFISTFAYYETYYKTVKSAAACCPEISLHPASCWTPTWWLCWNVCSTFVPVSLKTSEESYHYWLMRKSCVQIHFHYSALLKCWHVWDFFVKNKCFFSHLKKCLLQLAWTSSFYEFSGNVSV